MVERTLRIGVLGARGIMRSAHVPAWRAIPGVEILAIADAKPEAAQRLAAESSIPRCLSSLADLLAMREIDVSRPGVRWDTRVAPPTVAAGS